MNLATLRVEGKEESLNLLCTQLGIIVNTTWKKGDPKRCGGVFASSGLNATICDAKNPSEMFNAIRGFLDECKEKDVAFSKIDLSAELSIGVTVGDTEQFISILALTACGKKPSEAPTQNIAPTPTHTPIPAPALPPEPHFVPKHTPAEVVQKSIGQQGTDWPDLNRPMEPLEQFPLESLKIVGYLNQNKVGYAVVRAPDTKLYRVKAGNYLGMNFGLIQEVNNTEVKVKELVQDNSGNWTERNTSLQFLEASSGSQTSKNTATAPSAATEIPVERNYEPVQVFYATDRKASGSNEPSKYYGARRSDVTYGKCIVSIPSNHKTGELESPSIIHLEFSEDPKKHIVLLKIIKQNKKSYFKEIGNTIRVSRQKNAFIFIHGYNVTFEDAARRTAQIASDLNFDGAPVFYSWPSLGSKFGYPADENSIDWTQSHLVTFINDFVSKTDARNIFFIAHSMGSRALTKALISVVRRNPEFRNRFKEVILAAPDIDADTFKTQIAPALIASSKGITLYESSTDTALNLSEKVNGNYPRAGDAKSGLVLVKGIETIDATNIDTSFNNHPLEWLSSIGHTYYASRSVMEDIFYLIEENKRPDQRFGLTHIDSGPVRYWTFKK